MCSRTCKPKVEVMFCDLKHKHDKHKHDKHKHEHDEHIRHDKHKLEHDEHKHDKHKHEHDEQRHDKHKLEHDEHKHDNTRQSRSLHPFITSSVGKGEAIYRSFSFHGVNIWNYLSKHIPSNVSYNCFNKLTKSYLLNINIIYRLV